MHEFNIKFFTEIGLANNLNFNTTYIKFFSGTSDAIFRIDSPICRVHTAVPVPEKVCLALYELHFVPVLVLEKEVIWKHDKLI